MEMNAPALCPICKKPIPPKRFRLLTCGSHFCSNASKGITRKSSINKDSIVGIASENDLDQIRSSLEQFFQVNGHPKYPDRDDFEEWIRASGVCKGMRQITLRQAITALIVKGDFKYVRLGGTSRGRRHVKFMYIGDEVKEEGLVATDC